MREREHPARRDPWWLFKYVLVSAGDGIAAGWTFLLILLWTDIGGLGDLVHRSDDGPMALLILLVSFGVTFSYVGIGWRVMVLLGRDE